MIRINRFAILFAFAVVVAPWTSSADDIWIPVTSHENSKCPDRVPCRITEEGAAFAIEFSPTLFNFGKQLRQKLDTLKIKNLSSASSEPESYALAEMNYLPEKDFYKLYQIRLRPTGETDLALKAYSSAREGPLYYYFLFDKKAKRFVISEEPLPRLKLNTKTGHYLSDLQGVEYILNDKLQFVAGE